MKKLMIALAAVAFGLSAQAVMVNWDTYTIYAPGASGTGWSDLGNDVLTDVGTTAYTVSIILASDAALSSVVAKGSTTEITSDSNASGTTGDLFSKGGTYYGQLVVADATKSLTSEIFKFTIDAGYLDDTYYIGIADGASGITPISDSISFDGDNGAFQAGGWQSVPEPTSGLLLLLGVAGLALKRKRA